MRIPDEKIEEVRSASEIVDVVGEYVHLKKKGANYFGLCPFHHEKTPSFSVNPSLGIYKCFGCGVAGDVFQFINAVEQASFVESVRLLAERAGIALPEGGDAEDEDSAEGSVLHALRYAARFFFRQLTAEAWGEGALEYLRNRGFTNATIKRFGLGYAPEAWDALLAAARRDHVSDDALLQAGLIVQRKESAGFYDRFRNRLIFPIIAHMGRVVGFGGRILDSDADQPKYVNSPETIVYHKGRVLYGLYQSRQAIRQEGEVILVEGYTDVLALHQAGVEHVVASSGTALTPEQVALLGRYAQRVVLLYDADAAGASASVRGMERVLEAGMAADAIALPEGHDPDSFIRELGGDAFRQYVNDHRQDFISFRYQLAERGGALGTPDGQAEAVGAVLDLIAVVGDPILQETYLQRAAEVSGMPRTTLWRALEQRRGSRQGGRQRAPERAPRRVVVGTQASSESASLETPGAKSQGFSVLPAEEALLRLMLEHGVSMVEFVLGHMNLGEFSEGAPRRLAAAILHDYEANRFDPRSFTDTLRDDDELTSFVAGIMTDREVPSRNWERRNIPVPRLNEDALQAAAGAMTRLKLHHVHREIERIREATRVAQTDGSSLAELQREGMALHDLRKQIERREFINWPDTAQGSR